MSSMVLQSHQTSTQRSINMCTMHVIPAIKPPAASVHDTLLSYIAATWYKCCNGCRLLVVVNKTRRYRWVMRTAPPSCVKAAFALRTPSSVMLLASTLPHTEIRSRLPARGANDTRSSLHTHVPSRFSSSRAAVSNRMVVVFLYIRLSEHERDRPVVTTGLLPATWYKHAVLSRTMLIN